MGLGVVSRGQGVGNLESNDKEKASSSKLKEAQQFCCSPGFTCLATRSSKRYEIVYAWPNTQQALNKCLRIKTSWMKGDGSTSTDLSIIFTCVIEPGSLQKMISETTARNEPWMS